MELDPRARESTETEESLEQSRVETICDTIIKNLSDGRHGSAHKTTNHKSPANHLQLQMQQHKKSESLTAFGEALAKEAKKIMDGHAYGCLIGMTFVRPPREYEQYKKFGDSKPQKKGNYAHTKVPETSNAQTSARTTVDGRKPKATSDVSCHGCGRKGHTPEICLLKSNPHWNPNKDVMWRQSPQASSYPAIWETLPFGKNPLPSGEQIYSLISATSVISDALIGNDDVQCTVPTLFDTGALQGNYGTINLGNKLKGLGFQARRKHGEVCSAFGDCRPVKETFDLWLFVNKNAFK